ncbi:MarR family winged helix-turn-helix transcriptional regulator [Leifsonia sp. LS-T14]|uniref:MarR family winged helix-turn-helix transcriptional regulator n=1 Tax=unclassified Leifsonia TaxID=2663824 RepID=UPI0035A72AF2
MSESPADRHLDASELDSWSALATLLEWLPPELDRPLVENGGLTHFEYGILYALDSAPGSALRLRVLAGYANSALPRLSRALDRLEKRDWVRREPDPEDGRSTLAVLRPEGRAILRRMTPIHERNVTTLVFDRLTPAQSRQLRDISHRILSGIRDDAAWHPEAAPR